MRCIHRLPKQGSAERLDAWLAWASRSRLKPFIKFASAIRKRKGGVLAAIRLGISNGRASRRLAQGSAPVTPRIRISLCQCADRDGLFLLRWHPDHPPSPMSHPKPRGNATFRCQGLDVARCVLSALVWRSTAG
ncbi:MAG: transposase [Solirubrobacteraceae bacterium]